MKATRVCSAEGCGKSPHARGLCSSHYDKARWAGTLPAKVTQTVSERLWSRVVVSTSGCWEWQGSRNRDGYGNIRRGRGTALTHRLAWELANGRPPGELLVCHSCDNPPCINPDHLFLGTVRDNAIDMAAKGRAGGQKRTHCPAGHEHNETNTYRYPDGRRKCRQCERLRDHERRARLKASA